METNTLANPLTEKRIAYVGRLVSKADHPSMTTSAKRQAWKEAAENALAYGIDADSAGNEDLSELWHDVYIACYWEEATSARLALRKLS